MLLQAFVVGTQANRFAFFSIFQTHRVYMYTISWPNLSSLSAFSITIHKSQQREERQLKKNCISSNPPSASISFAVFLKIVSISKNVGMTTRYLACRVYMFLTQIWHVIYCILKNELNSYALKFNILHQNSVF